MGKSPTESITAEQIQALRSEATAVLDWGTAITCTIALDEDGDIEPARVNAALALCVTWINAASLARDMEP